MVDQGKISASQLEFMMVPTVIATGLLSLPAVATQYARHDMWMVPIIGSIIGFITVYLVWKLHKLYPELTPIQYSEKILGKIMGKLIGLILVLFFVHNTGIVVRQYSEFISFNVMRETPTVALSISILFVCALAVRGGIEVIARTSVICTTLFMVSSVSLLLLIKDIDVTNMLPVLEHGFTPVLQGGIIFQSWFGEVFLLAFLYPYVKNQSKSLKAGMKITLYIMLIFLYVNFFVLTLLGLSSLNQLYPLYSALRAISVLGFFENFEVIITASWVLGNFVKLAIFLYVASTGLAQLVGCSDYRMFVFPLTMLLIFFSYWDIPNIVVLMEHLTKIQPFYFFSVQTILPFILLLVALARRKRSESS